MSTLFKKYSINFENCFVSIYHSHSSINKFFYCPVYVNIFRNKKNHLLLKGIYCYLQTSTISIKRVFQNILLVDFRIYYIRIFRLILKELFVINAS